MQPQGAPAFRLFDPFLVEPVLRPLRVAVEPQLAAPDTAPGHRLLHKGPGHQRRLIQQQSRQGAALDQRRAGSVLPAEQQKLIPVSGVNHRQRVGRAVFLHLHADPPQAGEQFCQKIPPQSPHRLAAQGELPSTEIVLGPQEKGQPHAECLSAADSPVADDGLPAPLPPPGQHPPLFGGKAERLIPHGAPPAPGQVLSMPGTAGRCPGAPHHPAASTVFPAPAPGPPA